MLSNPDPAQPDEAGTLPGAATTTSPVRHEQAFASAPPENERDEELPMPHPPPVDDEPAIPAEVASRMQQGVRLAGISDREYNAVSGRMAIKGMPTKTVEDALHHMREIALLQDVQRRAMLADAKKRQAARLEAEALERQWMVEILPNFEAKKGSNQLRDALIKGVPASVRPVVWKMVIGNARRIAVDDYQRCVDGAAAASTTCSNAGSFAGDAAVVEAATAAAASYSNDLPRRDGGVMEAQRAGGRRGSVVGARSGAPRAAVAARRIGIRRDRARNITFASRDTALAARRQIEADLSRTHILQQHHHDEDSDALDRQAAGKPKDAVAPEPGPEEAKSRVLISPLVGGIDADGGDHHMEGAADMEDDFYECFSDEGEAVTATGGDDGEYAAATAAAAASSEGQDAEAKLPVVDVGVPRVDPFVSAVGQLLQAFVQLQPDTGYVQGMSYLAGMLLYELPPYDAFVAMANLLATGHFSFFYNVNPRAMAAFINVFAQALEIADPHLGKALMLAGALPELYVVEWWMTLFSRSLPIDVARRCWDMYLADEGMLIRVSVALVLTLKEDILRAPDEALVLLTTLGRRRVKVDWEGMLARAANLKSKAIPSLQWIYQITKAQLQPWTYNTNI